MYPYHQIFFIIIGSSLFSFFICRFLAFHPKFLADVPNSRSSHKKQVSRGGGLAFSLPALVIFFIFLWPSAYTGGQALCLGAVFFVVLGLLDDKYNLKPSVRLVLSFVFISLLCFEGLADSMVIFGLHLSGWPLLCLQILWIISGINFFNFMDGIDGLAGLQALWISLVVSMASLVLGSYEIFWSYLGLIAALGSFLYWNWPRARLFMGDGGSYFLGFVCSFAALLIGQQSIDLTVHSLPKVYPIYLDTGIVILAWLPFLLDTVLTLLVRIWGKKNIFNAHREHLYQQLVSVQSQWKVEHILFFYISVNLTLLLPMLCWLVLPQQYLNLFISASFLILYTFVFSFLKYIVHKKSKK